METQHTPRPWKNVTEAGRNAIHGNDPDRPGCIVEITDRVWDKANAEYIVRACNSHEDLLAACKQAHALMSHVGGFADTVALLDAAIAKAAK